ncbi:MAG: DMT family transporter [Acidimicrobiales bacterium]
MSTSAPPITSSSANLRGAGWMTLGMLGYVVNDAFIKLAAEEIPLFEAIFLRGLVITMVLVLLTRSRGEFHSLREHLNRPLGLRVATETLATVLYLLALTKLPIAGITAVLQIVPVAVTFAAARLLRERVSLARVGAVLVGFIGVLLVVKPGTDDFSPWYIAGFLAVFVIVVRELATTRIPSSVPSLVVALGTAVAITTMGGVVSLGQGWERPDISVLGLLVGASAFLTLGYVASVVTVRTGDLSFSAPFRYTVLVFAIVLQIVVFGDVPDALTFVGTAIIGAAGLWAFWREQVITAPIRRG